MHSVLGDLPHFLAAETNGPSYILTSGIQCTSFVSSDIAWSSDQASNETRGAASHHLPKHASCMLVCLAVRFRGQNVPAQFSSHNFFSAKEPVRCRYSKGR